MPVGEFVDRKIGPIRIGNRQGGLLPPGSGKEWDVEQDQGSGEEHGKYVRVVDSDSIEVGFFIDCSAMYPRVLRKQEINTDQFTRNRLWWKP